jgi:outer membrane protein
MKKWMICVYTFFLFLSQAALSTTLLAQDNNKEGNDEDGYFNGQWSLGMGGEYETNPYKGADDEITPLPLILYHGERFFLEGLTAGFLLVDWNDFEISVIGQYEMEGYEANDSVFLHGMDTRGETFEMGLNIEYEILFGELELTAVYDVLGQYKGQRIDLEYGIELETEKLTLEPYVGINWQSSDFADYYYGVKQTEARSWRPAYKVGSVMNTVIGLDMSYCLSKHWMMRGAISYEMLDDDIEKSPIVEEDALISCFFGLSYVF